MGEKGLLTQLRKNDPVSKLCFLLATRQLRSVALNESIILQ